MPRLDRIQMIDLQHGWAVTDGAQVLATADGGESWRIVTPPDATVVGDSAVDLLPFFLDAMHAWVLYDDHSPHGYYPEIWTTPDGGQTWASYPRQEGVWQGSRIIDLGFLDEQFGWFVGAWENGPELDVYRTGNGGQAWFRPTILKVGEPWTSRATWLDNGSGELAFGDHSIGLWAGAAWTDNILLRTRDGGLSWQELRPHAPPGWSRISRRGACSRPSDPAMYSASSASFVMTCRSGHREQAFLYRSLDGGSSWDIYPVPGADLLLLDETTGWAAVHDQAPPHAGWETYRTYLYRTIDGGRSWQRIKRLAWDGSFSFVDRYHGWAIARQGDAMALVRTRDSGRTWEMMAPRLVAGPAGSLEAAAPTAIPTPLPASAAPLTVLPESGNKRLTEAQEGSLLPSEHDQYDRAMNDVAWSPDGSRLAAVLESGLVIWEMPGGAEVLSRTFDPYPGFKALAWSPDGAYLATIGHLDVVAIWDAGSGEELQRLELNLANPQTIGWSPDGATLAFTDGQDDLLLWEWRAGTAPRILRSQSIWISELAWSPDGSRLASAGLDGAVRIWDVESGTVLLVLEGHESAVNSVAWSPDGDDLASAGSDGTVRIWDTADGQLQRIFQLQSEVIQVAWSPDGAWLAASTKDSYQDLLVWNPDLSTGLQVYGAPWGGDLSWSPAGDLLASAGSVEVQLWESPQ